MSRIVNLTPHPLNLIGLDGDDHEYAVVIAPEPTPARCDDERISIGWLTMNGVAPPKQDQFLIRMPLNQKSFGPISGLPDPIPGTFYVVSLPVAQAARATGRTDCLVVDDIQRDERGVIVGAKALARI